MTSSTKNLLLPKFRQMKLFYQLILLLVLLQPQLFAQSNSYKVPFNTTTINFSTLIAAIKKPDLPPQKHDIAWVHLTDVAVRYNEADKIGMDKRFKEGGETWTITNDIVFDNVDFDDTYWLVLRNIRFEGIIKFSSCKNLKVIFKDCVFKHAFKINATDIGFMRFENCDFKNGFMYQFSAVAEDITFDACKFSIDLTKQENIKYSVFNRYDIENHLFELLNKTEPFDVNFLNCRFDVPQTVFHLPKYRINLANCNFKNLRFDHTTINANLNLSATTVENEFLLEGGSFSGKIIIDAFNINPQNARLQWSLLEGHKISIFDKDGKLINGLSEVHVERLYNRLIGCYSTFYQVFKSQGNRFYANKAYIEWKNIETNYLRYTFEQKPDSQIYFLFLMNLFLRDFCSYGTDPLQSIYLSGLVIILFAVCYFLFPAPISSHRLHRKVLLKNKLQNFYLRYLSATPATQSINKNFLQSYPLVSFITYYIFYVGVYSYFLLLKCLDALSLSLNVFSTLGFGEIPINGAVRYLTILEGFIGWFLLSIFSVCLISQVIQ